MSRAVLSRLAMRLKKGVRARGVRATPLSRLRKGLRREENTRTSLVRTGGRSPIRSRCFIAPGGPRRGFGPCPDY